MIYLPVPRSVKEKEQKINKELEQLEFHVHFKINSVNLEHGAWEYTIGFFDILPKEDNDKVYDIIFRHKTEWEKEQNLR